MILTKKKNVFRSVPDVAHFVINNLFGSFVHENHILLAAKSNSRYYSPIQHLAGVSSFYCPFLFLFWWNDNRYPYILHCRPFKLQSHQLKKEEKHTRLINLETVGRVGKFLIELVCLAIGYWIQYIVNKCSSVYPNNCIYSAQSHLITRYWARLVYFEHE